MSSKTIEVSKAVVKLCRNREVYDFLGLIAFSVLEIYLDHLLCLLCSYRTWQSDGTLCSCKLHLLAAAERDTANWNCLFQRAYTNIRTYRHYIHAYIHTYVSTHTYTRTHIRRIDTHTHTHTHTYITYIHTYIHKYTHCINTYIHTSVDMEVHTYIYIYIYIIYIYTYIRVCTCMYTHTYILAYIEIYAYILLNYTSYIIACNITAPM